MAPAKGGNVQDGRQEASPSGPELPPGETARYIADFTCRSPVMMVVEIDGETHIGREDYDLVRTRFFEARGYHVLRFSNHDVMSNLDGVLTTIVSALADSPSPQPFPLKGRGG